MRFFITIKNSLYGLGTCIFTGLVSLILRKVFIEYLPIEYLGYEGIFSNLFILFSIVDMGLEDIITYRLYPAFARKDYNTISNLLAIYKKLYKYVGLTVFAMSVACIPFVKLFAKGRTISDEYAYIIYIANIVMVLCGYFLSYKRIMFVVDQKLYVCSKIEACCSFGVNLLKILSIILFKDYFVYLFLGVVNNIAKNILISKKVDSNYGYLKSNAIVKFEDIKKLDIWKDIKSNLVQKISLIVYSGTDNIIIGWLLGVSYVGLYANYLLLSSMFQGVIDRCIQPIKFAIGNIVYSDAYETVYSHFRVLDFISFLIANFVGIVLFNLLNSFISLWLSTDYLLDDLFLLFFVLDAYVAWNHHIICFFRNSFGKYELDRTYILAGTFLNLVISVFLCNKIGIAGVLFGTVIGHIGFWIGRVVVVYSECINENVTDYFFRQCIRVFVFCLNSYIVYRLCNLWDDTISGFMLKSISCLIVPNLMVYVIFRNTYEMSVIKAYFKRMTTCVKEMSFK